MYQRKGRWIAARDGERGEGCRHWKLEEAERRPDWEGEGWLPNGGEVGWGCDWDYRRPHPGGTEGGDRREDRQGPS